jgi:hypothetical protein
VFLHIDAMAWSWPQFAADAELQVGREAQVELRSHDTEMLVKVMYACVHPEFLYASFPRLHGNEPPILWRCHRAVERGAQTGDLGELLGDSRA